MAVSPGSVTGPVKVLRNPREKPVENSMVKRVPLRTHRVVFFPARILLDEFLQPIEHLLVREDAISLLDDTTHNEERLKVNNGLKNRIGSNPHVGGVTDSLLLELEGDTVVDIVADVLFVGEDLLDHAARPERGRPGGGSRD